MHQRNIVHRDIKAENILIDNLDDISVKVTDFGFATYFNASEKLDLQLGSPFYMPPEIIKQEEYDEKVDIWSAGVLTYLILSSEFPFNGRTEAEI